MLASVSLLNRQFGEGGREGGALKSRGRQEMWPGTHTHTHTGAETLHGIENVILPRSFWKRQEVKAKKKREKEKNIM